MVRDLLLLNLFSYRHNWPHGICLVKDMDKIARLDVKAYCGTWAWINLKTGEKMPFYCGGASCGRSICRRKFWKKRILTIACLIREYNLIRFFTLTLDREKVSVNGAWNEIPHIWLKMRKRLRRRFPELKFVAVLEAHKDTRYPHIHGFTNIWMKQAEWSDMWADCGGGPVVWIEAVTDDVEAYVTKELEVANYVGKDNLLDAKSMLEAGKRSFWRSENTKAKFELDKSDPEWVVLKRQVFERDFSWPDEERTKVGESTLGRI